MSIFTTTIYGEKMRKKQIYVTLCLIALAMLGMCFFYLKKTGWGMTGDKAWNELIDNAGNRRPAVLRLTSNENDDLCAKILLYDKEYNLIQMWTMYPTRQQAVAPGKCFSTDVITSDRDGIVTVTLKNIQNPTDPAEEILQDEVLCKWKK